MTPEQQKEYVDAALDSLADLRDHLITLSKTASAEPDVDPDKVLDFIKGMHLWA